MAFDIISDLIKNKSSPKRKNVFNGLTKQLFTSGVNEENLFMHFKDTIRNKEKIDVPGIGIINNKISSSLMGKLNIFGLRTHFIKKINMREQLVKAADVFPFAIKIFNNVTDEMIEKNGIDADTEFSEPIFEIILDSNGKRSSVSRQFLNSLRIVDDDDVEQVFFLAQRINDFLGGYFLSMNYKLASISLNFGKIYNSDFWFFPKIILVNEVSLSNCVFVDLIDGGSVNFSKLDVDPSDEKAISECIKKYKEFKRRFEIVLG